MKIIKPIPITDAKLYTQNVTGDIPHSAWASGSTYAAGDYVSVDSPSSTVTMTAATPAVITWANHGFPVDTPIVFTTSGALYSGITAGRAYFIYSVTTNTFQVCSEIGGAPIQTYGSQSGTHTATASTHKWYESLQAGNTGRIPRLTANSAWWLDRGNTNAWLHYDESLTSQMVADGTFCTFTLTSPLDSFILFNVSAASVRVIVTGTTEGIVYDETASLVDHGNIGTFWEWFFIPRRRKKIFAITDLPPVNSGTLTWYVTETNADSTVRVGKVVIGMSIDIGDTLYGARLSSTDWSVKTLDTWGNYTFVEGNYNSKGNFTVTVDHEDVDTVFDILAENQARPAVYIGHEDYKNSIAYGIAQDAEIAIEYPTVSILTFQVEGLT